MRLGNLQQYGDKAFMEELIHWLRFNQKDALAARDGLDSRCSGNPDVPRWHGQMFVAGGKPEQQAAADTEKLRSSPGAFVIAAEADTYQHAGVACVGDTSRVGSYPSGASPYGAMDMAGNVWEWVNDWYLEDYYTVSPASNPSGPTTGEERVLRGGAWHNPERRIRAAYRDHYASSGGFSIRCARTQ